MVLEGHRQAGGRWLLSCSGEGLSTSHDVSGLTGQVVLEGPGPRVLEAFKHRLADALLRSMPSAFEGLVRSVVRELDHSRELIPVHSLRSSTSFQPYRLLSRKSPSSWFWRPRYTCVNLSIKDILEPDAPEPGTPPAAETEPSQEWPGHTCPLPALGLWPCLQRDGLFKGPTAWGWDRAVAGGTGPCSGLVLLQSWSVVALSTSMMLWTASCRAVWSWQPRDKGRSQVELQCPAAPGPP